MKTKEIRKLKPEEYDKKMSEAKRELMILQGQAKTGTPPKNPGMIKKLRRTIAKMHTIRNEKNKEEQ
ncbi:50S ribosomal protein L29 [Candidatus Woesearchaeota archaeon]|nr:50S ribosomal protein L29 [Candidatus Woesearchaeota archaeon]